jgi:hypothetical protein
MSNIKFIQLEAYKAPVAVEDKRNDWVNYGENNDFYQYLIDAYNKSTTNNAIINNIVKLAYGKGLKARDAKLKPEIYAKFISMFGKGCIKKVIKDYKILGNAAFQILYKDGKREIGRVEHIPAQLLRAGKCNEKGEITHYFYSDNWEDTKKYEPKQIPAFGYGNKNQLVEILFIQNYTIGAKYYGEVDYKGGLPYCKLEEEVAEYLINEVQNSFAPTTIVNFNNGVPDDEKQELIANKVKGTLTGSRGKKVVVGFNDDETKKTTVDSIPLNDAPEHYSYLSEECQKKIMLAHNVTSPLLFGIASTNGFSSNADELRNSYILFENMVIKPIQETILDAIDVVLGFNQMALDLFFEPLQPLDVDGDLTNEAQAVQMSSDKDLAQSLIDLGEDLDENEWELVDSRDVNYEDEEELDLQIRELNKPKQSLLSKIINFVSTGTARPNAKSEQDATIDGVNYIVRYAYEGQTTPKSREFCKRMVKANKLYRKEDILAMENQVVNEGWGANGADTYSIWLYKGGGSCHHKWVRKTFASKTRVDVNNPNAPQISTNKAEREGYRVRNPKEVSMMPKDMPNQGFLPKE